jgi:hypothetical protein
MTIVGVLIIALPDWIPAFAGMTNEATSTASSFVSEERLSW